MKKSVLFMCLFTLCVMFVGCGDSSDDPKSVTNLKGTSWEGTLSKLKDGATQHVYSVTMKFTGTNTANYNYNGGGSSFSYVMSSTAFNISNCRYSNINGTWTIKKVDSKNLQIEKNDGHTYQSFELKPKTDKK